MDDFVLPIRADQDIDVIAHYNLEVWGEAQARGYIFNLFESFNVLAEKPELG